MKKNMKKKHEKKMRGGALSGLAFFVMAERTGLEPATPGVTGRYSNQLNYRSCSEQPLRRTMVGAAGLEPATFAL